jgi:hypothetical protein
LGLITWSPIHPMKRVIIFLAVAIASCAPDPASTPSSAVADVAILRAALFGWQEGPTDGRICLDPRVLRMSSDTVGPALRWAPAVLSDILRDTLIAIDSTVRPLYLPGARACTPTIHRPRIAIGIPVLAGDSAVMLSAAFDADSVLFPRDERQWLMVLRMRDGEWLYSHSPGVRFVELPP